MDNVETSVEDLLNEATKIIAQRGETYDNSSRERSMEKTVELFNLLTGQELTTAEGWQFMAILKQVRFWQNPDFPHRDSVVDAVNYIALMGEEALSKKNNQSKF